MKINKIDSMTVLRYIGIPIRFVLYVAFLLLFTVTYGWILPLVAPRAAMGLWADVLKGREWILAL